MKQAMKPTNMQPEKQPKKIGEEKTNKERNEKLNHEKKQKREKQSSYSREQLTRLLQEPECSCQRLF